MPRPSPIKVVKALWPIIFVLVFHQKIQRTPYRVPLGFVMHFSGGLTISYFIYWAQEW